MLPKVEDSPAGFAGCGGVCGLAAFLSAADLNGAEVRACEGDLALMGGMVLDETGKSVEGGAIGAVVAKREERGASGAV